MDKQRKEAPGEALETSRGRRERGGGELSYVPLYLRAVYERVVLATPHEKRKRRLPFCPLCDGAKAIKRF